MKKLYAGLLGLFLAVGIHAATFNQFTPATGVLKGSASTPVTTAATAADIVALWSTCVTNEYLNQSGTCDLINLAASVTGTLPVANGGTNLTAATDDNVMVGNGTTWQSKAIGDCDDTGGNHLNYDTGTNAFSCGTSGGSSVTPSALTRVDDTNVTLTLGGTPSTALLQATSITAGWTGTLANTRGGTGTGTYTTGDMLYASGSNTLGKRSIGSTNDVLAVVGGVPTWSQAITPTWSGGHTFGATTTFSTGATAQVATINSTAAGGPFVSFQRSGTGFGDIGNGGQMGGGFTTDALAISARTSRAVQIGANGTGPHLTVNTSGNTLAAGTLGGTDTVYSTAAADPKIYVDVSGSERAYLNYTTSTTTARVDSDGLLTIAPNNTVASTWATDGGMFMAGATGASKGSGTINATAVYVNGTALGTTSGVAIPSSTRIDSTNVSTNCTVAGIGTGPTYSGIQTCSRTGTGTYTITFSAVLGQIVASTPVCTVNAINSSSIRVGYVFMSSTSAGTVLTYDPTTGAAADATQMYITCVYRTA